MNYLLDQHKSGNFLILQSYGHLTGMSSEMIYSLQDRARLENAPYDVVDYNRKEDEWMTLRNHVVQNAPIRQKIDKMIHADKKRKEEGIPF